MSVPGHLRHRHPVKEESKRDSQGSGECLEVVWHYCYYKTIVWKRTRSSRLTRQRIYCTVCCVKVCKHRHTSAPDPCNSESVELPPEFCYICLEQEILINQICQQHPHILSPRHTVAIFLVIFVWQCHFFITDDVPIHPSGTFLAEPSLVKVEQHAALLWFLISFIICEILEKICTFCD